MADPRAFVSFDFDHDETSKNLFVGQAKSDSPTPFTVSDWSSKSALPEAEWEKLVAGKINVTNLVIVLVGRYVISATGVTKEIAMAKLSNVPVFGVYVDGAGTNTTLPLGLARNRVVSWTWPNVAAGIDQMMTEGKNAS
jgi:antiphage defense system Thoeris ThsB-like protein